MHKSIIAGLAGILFLTVPVLAQHRPRAYDPCGKQGVSFCEGRAYVCRDGSIRKGREVCDVRIYGKAKPKRMPARPVPPKPHRR